jgi:protein-S-isoprenylcysteine O-methyltransferase Ste14
VWTTSILPFLAGALAGLLDPATLGLTSFSWRVVGLASMIAGSLLLAWGIGTLSWAQSLGRGQTLITEGPYRFTRNPQYIGDLALIAGFVLWSDSPRALSVAIAISIAVCLFPRTEEPWLGELFGDAYTRYRRRTPRFLWRFQRT